MTPSNSPLTEKVVHKPKLFSIDCINIIYQLLIPLAQTCAPSMLYGQNTFWKIGKSQFFVHCISMVKFCKCWKFSLIWGKTRAILYWNSCHEGKATAVLSIFIFDYDIQTFFAFAWKFWWKTKTFLKLPKTQNALIQSLVWAVWNRVLSAPWLFHHS